MKITYIGHSGFAVEYEDVAFIFDYYKGKLPEFKNAGKVYVFASHNHFDHFTEKIFSWVSEYPEITYILSDDIEADGPAGYVKKIGPDQRMDVDDIHIKTLRSTDEGVAFFLSVNGKKIFHAGDLNWWHWEEEGPLYNQFMKKNFLRAIEKIRGEHIDAAFFPVDPRLNKAYFWGIDWFMRETDTEVVFPMHMQNEQKRLYVKLMEEPKTEPYRHKIKQVEKEGQEFRIES